MAREYWKFGFDAPERTIDPLLTYRLGKRTDNRALTRSHANLSVAMLTRSAFLCGLTLVLSVETTAEAVRADVLDGFASHFIAKPFFRPGVMRRSSADPHNRLSAHSCDELWYERNVILWSAGFCFHESRGVRMFGNAACGYNRVYEVPLRDEDSRLISLLELAEDAKGCLGK